MKKGFVLCFLFSVMTSCLEDIDLDTGERFLNVYCVLSNSPEQELELSYMALVDGTSRPVGDEDGNPVKGIQVTVRQNWRYTKPAENKLFTDTEGTFQLIREVFDGPESITVTFEDVDGEENGGDFASAEVSPEITHTKKGDHDFYGGAFEARADIQLKKK